MFNKKVLIGTIIFSIIVFIGFIQINIVNTRALSPIGNGEDNYELVKEEFGEDFEEFIRDDADIKIYTTSEDNESTSIKVSDKEFTINANNPITEKFYMLGSNIYNGFNSIKNKINGKIKNINEKIKNDKGEETNSVNKDNKEVKDSDENKRKDTSNNKLDKIVDDFLEKDN